MNHQSVHPQRKIREKAFWITVLIFTGLIGGVMSIDLGHSRPKPETPKVAPVSNPVATSPSSVKYTDKTPARPDSRRNSRP